MGDPFVIDTLRKFVMENNVEYFMDLFLQITPDKYSIYMLDMLTNDTDNKIIRTMVSYIFNYVSNSDIHLYLTKLINEGSYHVMEIAIEYIPHNNSYIPIPHMIITATYNKNIDLLLLGMNLYDEDDPDNMDVSAIFTQCMDILSHGEDMVQIQMGILLDRLATDVTNGSYADMIQSYIETMISKRIIDPLLLPLENLSIINDEIIQSMRDNYYQ